jgi:hypothetical protein
MIRGQRPEPPLAALEELRQREVPADSRAGDDTRRRIALQATTRLILEEARRKRRVRWVAGSAAAAAVLALAGAGRHEFEARRASRAQVTSSAPVEKAPAELRVTAGVIVATRPGREETVSAGGRIAISEGEEIRTAPDGRGLLALPLGVSVELGFATQAWVDVARAVEQRIRLDLGKVEVSVPTPGGPKTVAIATPDAEVLVHGTQFSVHVERAEPAPSTITSVTVTRGSVLVVRHGEQQLITAGGRWSSLAVKPVDAANASGEAPASTEIPQSQERREPRIVSRAEARKGALTDQNRLFQAALDARKAGDDVAVLRNLDELLARFPGTALEQDVQLTRIRALKRLGRLDEASREAGRYLKAHPDAPAQDEARRIFLKSRAKSSQ